MLNSLNESHLSSGKMPIICANIRFIIMLRKQFSIFFHKKNKI